MGTLTPSTTSATTTNTSSTSGSSSFQLLEITVISAQDLALISKSMRTYAVVWIYPYQKLSTRIDNQGQANPTWNDKFVFRIDDQFLGSEISAVMIEIYTVSWFRDNLVGSIRVLINDLIPPYSRIRDDYTTRFVALQVRRASGNPQGILNMGVSLVDSSMPAYSELSSSANGISDLMDKKMHKHDRQKHHEDEQLRVNAKIQLWRSRSERTELNCEDSPQKTASIYNDSAVNGSELCSDVGPSASVVAAAIATRMYQSPGEKRPVLAAEGGGGDHDCGGSILEDLTVEEAVAKGYRSKAEKRRMELPPAHEGSSSKAAAAAERSRNPRQQSPDAGLFSCFAYGFGFTIVCGANNNGNNGERNKKGTGSKPIKRSSSHKESLL